MENKIKESISLPENISEKDIVNMIKYVKLCDEKINLNKKILKTYSKEEEVHLKYIGDINHLKWRLSYLKGSPKRRGSPEEQEKISSLLDSCYRHINRIKYIKRLIEIDDLLLKYKNIKIISNDLKILNLIKDSIGVRKKMEILAEEGLPYFSCLNKRKAEDSLKIVRLYKEKYNNIKRIDDISNSGICYYEISDAEYEDKRIEDLSEMFVVENIKKEFKNQSCRSSNEVNKSFYKWLESEVEYSDLFNRAVGIEFSFDLEQYDYIKNMFENRELISSIYGIIDNILSKKDMYLRNLIMGDVLFSMKSNSILKPTNIKISFTREGYMREVRNRYIINDFIGIKIDIYLKIHKKILIGLRKEKIFEREVFRAYNKKDSTWTTGCNYHLNVEKFNFISHFSAGVSKYPYHLIKIDKIKYSASSFRNVWKALRKKKEMGGVRNNFKGLIKANKIGFKLCNKTLDKNSNIINIELCRLIRSVECESIEKYLNTDKNSNKYQEFITTISKVIPIYYLFTMNLKNCFYLPNFIDNRSRQYYDTILSPSFYKLYRYLIKFDKVSKFKNLEESIYYSRIIKYKEMFKSYNLADREIYVAIVLSIEVGKIFIEKSLEYVIKIEKIIECGLENYSKKNMPKDFGDSLYINKIYGVLEDVLNKKEFDENCIIFKDATSSGLQNYGIILGYKYDMLKYLNLDGEDWCDTYSYIMRTFIDFEDVPMLKKRKYWKSTIMTIPYNSSWYTCYDYFLKKIREDDWYENLDLETKEKIKEKHIKFYNDLKNNIKDLFYINNSDKCNRLKKFPYYKFTLYHREEYKINYKNDRDKYVDEVYLVDYDEKGTLQALEANNMHDLDAKLVRYVLEEMDAICIHDCFGVRLCEVHLLMDNINRFYREKIFRDRRIFKGKRKGERIWIYSNFVSI